MSFDVNRNRWVGYIQFRNGSKASFMMTNPTSTPPPSPKREGKEVELKV